MSLNSPPETLQAPSIASSKLPEDNLAQAQQPISRFAWHTRTSRHLQSRFPNAHARIGRIVSYLKGPRPPILLPGPRSILEWNSRSPRRIGVLPPISLDLPAESWLMRRTRCLNKTWLFMAFAVIYIISLSFIVRAQWFLIPADSFVSCTDAFWDANDQCGLDGQECAPFSNVTFDFRCPAQCNSVILQNQRAVGAEEVAFVPLIVGGGTSESSPGAYRGDSFICAAAAHAGVISNSKGGCASLSLIGTQGPFESITANGLTSTSFPTFFPLSYSFTSTTSLTHCTDLRNVALAFNILCSCIAFLLLRPKPIVLFWSMVCMGYWHIIFFSQPAGTPPPISDAFGTFLPALFIAYAFWKIAFQHVLPYFSGIPIERMVWYLAAFWPGVLFNILTDKIPIDRLLASDINKRPGALTALIIIIVVLVVIVVNQLRVMRASGWLLHYVQGYIVVGLVLLVLAFLPGLEFRLHHYFAAMLLMPLTAFPTRLSAIYQSFVLGMFLNGAAAFGFDSILQTAAELQRDGPAGTELPTFLTNSSTWNSSLPLSSQLIRWDGISANDPNGWNGFALIVDDVERFAGAALNYSLAALNASVPHFFRLAFQSGGTSGDFTRAATLWPNGSWVDPLPGPS